MNASYFPSMGDVTSDVRQLGTHDSGIPVAAQAALRDELMRNHVDLVLQNTQSKAISLVCKKAKKLTKVEDFVKGLEKRSASANIVCSATLY